MSFSFFAYLFFAYAWSRVFLRYREGTISHFELFLWSAVWGLAALVTARPAITSSIANQLGIGRGADLVIYGSIMCLVYLLFRMYIKMGMIEREITRLVRALALRETK